MSICVDIFGRFFSISDRARYSRNARGNISISMRIVYNKLIVFSYWSTSLHIKKDIRMRRKTKKFLFSFLLIGLAILVSACNLSLSSAAMESNLTQTAVSISSAQAVANPNSTPTIANFPTPSQTPDPLIPTATPQLPTNLPPTPGPKPPSYTLQLGEFPYCIARRFNVHPRELLAINNLHSGLIFAPGLVLTIPQSGHTFPPPRSLHPHPTTFTVPQSQLTVYKVACYFGDVDPATLMQYNGLTSPILTIGQILQIP
jgi:LysM repeat protein